MIQTGQGSQTQLNTAINQHVSGNLAKNIHIDAKCCNFFVERLINSQEIPKITQFYRDYLNLQKNPEVCHLNFK